MDMGGMARNAGDSRKTALVVLGMHRSGTSAMSRVLSLSGAALPEKVMPAALGNDLGHWEAQDVADLNDHILADLDSGWDDVFGPHRNGKARISSLKYLDAATKVIRENWADQPVIVVKEPRLNLLLELWSQALKDEGYRPTYVIMIRHPLEVAESLKKRNSFARNRSLMLWAKYMLSAETGTREYPRLFVKYDDLLNEPEEILDRIESSLDISLPRRSWLATSEIDRFLTTDARHHYATGKSLRKTLPAIQNYYEYLESAALGAPPNEDASSALRDWLATLEQAVGPILASLESNLREANRSVETKTALVTEANARLAAAEASFTGREQQLVAEIEESKATLSSLRSELEQQSARLQTAVDAAKAESLLYETNLTAHTEQAAHAQRQLEEARQALEDRVREMEAEQQRLSGELEAAQAQIAALTNSEAEARQALEERVSEAETERGRLAGELEAAQAQFAALANADAEARQALQDHIREMEAERKAEQDQLEGDLKAARAQISALTHLEAAARRAVDVRTREVEAERDHFARELEEARAQVAALTDLEAAARSVLEVRVRDIEAERDHFAKDLAETRRALEEAIIEKESESKLRESEAHARRNLNQELRSIRAEYDSVISLKDEILFAFKNAQAENENARVQNQNLADALAKQIDLSERLSQTLTETIMDFQHAKAGPIRRSFADLLRRLKAVH